MCDRVWNFSTSFENFFDFLYLKSNDFGAIKVDDAGTVDYYIHG